MNRQELMAIWLRHLDGEALSDAESNALLQGWEADPALRELCEADVALDGSLRSRPDDTEADRAFLAGVATTIRTEAEPDQFAAQIRRRIQDSARARQQWRRATIWAMAASLLIGLGVTQWWPGTAAPMPEPRPVVAAQTADLPHLENASSVLPVGSRVGGAQEVVLLWKDGSRGVLAAGGQLEITAADAGKTLRLESGRLELQAAHQPTGKPLIVRTPFAQATVVGTRFTIASDQNDTRLRVAEGAVRLTLGPGPGLTVRSGTGAVASAAGLRWLPVWSWDATDPASPQPTVGRRGTAPDGRICFVGELGDDPSRDVTGIRFHDSPTGLFTIDSSYEVWCEVWLDEQVAWAGLYLQDDAAQRRDPTDSRETRHGQVNLPLDTRGGWTRMRLPLKSLTAIRSQAPLIHSGDRANFLAIQAQYPSMGAIIYLASIEVLPSAP